MDFELGLQELEKVPQEKRLRHFLPTLISNGFFHHIEDPSPSSYQNYFHILESLALSSQPMGLGIGMASAVLATLPMNILGMAKSRWGMDWGWEKFQKEGWIFGFAVSEKGWGGNLDKLQMRLEEEEKTGDLRLNGSKSMVTNGGDADSFMVVVQDGTQSQFPIVILPKTTPGLQVTPISLGYLPEVSHVQLELDSVSVSKSQILPLDYKEYAKPFSIWERFSIQVLLAAFLNQYLEGEEWTRTRDRIQKRKEKVAQEGWRSLSWKDTMLLEWYANQFPIVVPGEIGKFFHWFFRK